MCCNSDVASVVEWGIQCQCWIPGSPLKINDHVNVTGTCLWYVTNLPLWLLQKLVLILRVPTRTSDRMSQWFPMNNIRVGLLIESSLVHLQRVRISHLCAKHASNGSCYCWKFLPMSICSLRCALTTVHQSFVCSWTALQGDTKSFWNKSIPVCLCLLTKFVVTCSERIQLPFSHCKSVLRDASKSALCGPAVSYSGSV